MDYLFQIVKTTN